MRARFLFVLAWIAAGAGCAEPTSEELMRLAQQALGGGETRTAEIHLRNLLREDPQNADARYLLGQALLSQGDAAAAEAAFRRALELGADPVSTQLPLLQSLLGQGKFQEVLAQIEAGPQLAAEQRMMVLRIAGLAHRGLNQFPQAEESFRSGLALDPDSSMLRSDLASLLLAQNRLEDARRLIVDVLSGDPSYGPALLLRGTLEALSRRIEDAMATFRQVIELEGPQGESYFSAMTQLTEALTLQGNIDEATARADELLARYPNHPVPNVLKASLEVRAGTLDPARRRLEDVLSRAPTYAPANRLLGVVNAEQGRTQQAQMYLQNAVAQGDPRAILQLAKLNLDQGNPDAAQELLLRSYRTDQTPSTALVFAAAARAALQAGERELAQQFLEHASGVMTGDPQEVLGVAAIYSEAGNLERAKELLEAGSDQGGDAAWLPTFGLALTQLQQRDFDAAEENVERLIEMQPESAWPWNLRGMIAAGREDMPAAREYFSEALRLDPQSVPALLNRARVAQVENRREDAARDFQSVLEIDPTNSLALLSLAESAIGERNFGLARQWLERAPESVGRSRLEAALASVEGRHGDAADLFRQVFDQQPTVEHALQAFAAMQRAGRPDSTEPLVTWLAEHPGDAAANFALGSYLLEQGDHDQALQRLERVVQAQPQHAGALNNLAWLYNERGDSRAIELAERAHRAAPDNPAIADTLGWLYVQNGDAEAGLPLLEQSHAALPDNAEIHYHWAVALAETGSEERAAEALRDLLASHPEFEQRRDAEERLNRLR